MAKKSKSYRGQRKAINYCGCFHCGGHEKYEVIKLKYKHLNDKINELWR